MYTRSVSKNRMSLIVTTAVLIAFSVATTGCGKGSKKNVVIDGVVGPNVNFVDNKLTLSMTLKNVSLDYGTRIPIPKMNNSYLEIGPDFQSNGFLISVGIDAGDLKNLVGHNLDLLDPTTLPGGRPLPGVSDGFLPAIAIEVPKLDHMVFYVGKALFGVFVPVNLPWQNYMGTFRFYDGTNTPIGNLSIVGKDQNNANSGILLLISFAGKVGQLLGMN